MVTKASDRKVRFLEDDGKEVYVDDDPYAFLRFQEAGQLRPAKKPKRLESAVSAGDDVEAGDLEDEEDEKPDPEASISKLEVASAELQVLVDLLENVSTLKAITVQYADPKRDDWKNDSAKKPDAIRQKTNKAKELALQVEAKQKQLQDGAARIRAAAQLLRKSVQRENLFVAELSALQSFWRLQRQPGNEWAPYAVELRFPLAQSSSAAALPTAGSRDQPPALPEGKLVITQGFEGNLVVAVPVDETPVPSVQGSAEGSALATPSQLPPAVGLQEVHAMLQQRLARLMRRAVDERAMWETNLHMQAHFTQPLIQRTLKLMAAPESTSRVRLFNPIASGIMAAALARPKLAHVERLASLLLMYWQHQYFVNLLLRSLDEQAWHYPGTVVSLRLTGRPHTVAVHVDGRHRGSLVICCRGMSYSVQAMPSGPSPVNTACWLSEHYIKHVPQQEIGSVLMRYWGPTNADALSC